MLFFLIYFPHFLFKKNSALPSEILLCVCVYVYGQKRRSVWDGEDEKYPSPLFMQFIATGCSIPHEHPPSIATDLRTTKISPPKGNESFEGWILWFSIEIGFENI